MSDSAETTSDSAETVEATTDGADGANAATTATQRWWRRPVVRRGGLALLTLAAALGHWAVMFVQTEQTGFGDWQLVHHLWETGHASILRHGEFPLWDPHQCGGVPLFGNPEAPTYSPFFLLTLAVGPLIAQKVTVLLHAWFAYIGAYLLARKDHTLSVPASALVSLVFAGGGYFAWQIGGGHATFLPFFFAPWLLMSWRRAATDARGVIATAALLALTVMEGGTYPFPFFALMLAIETVSRLVAPRVSPADQNRRPGTIRLGVLRAILLGAGLTALLGAIRFVPIFETLSRFPRTLESTDYLRLHEFYDVFARAEYATWRHPPHPFVWVEYTAFVGAPVVLLAAAGALASLVRRRGGALFGFLASMALMAGAFSPYAPWSLLHHLPVFDSLRLPSRFSVIASLYLALLAGYGADAVFRAITAATNRVAERPLRTPQYVVAFVLVALTTYTGYAWSFEVTSTKWSRPPMQEFSYDRPFSLISPREYPRHLANMSRRNQGSPACYVGNMNWRVSPVLWVGERPQARLRDRRAGELGDVTRTQHTFTIHAELQQEGLVLLNQNYDPHWESNVGEVVDQAGLTAVRLPPGTYDLRVRYAPPTFWPAALASLLGWLLALLWWRAVRDAD